MEIRVKRVRPLRPAVDRRVGKPKPPRARRRRWRAKFITSGFGASGSTQNVSVAQSCHAWCHDCHSRSSGDRCAPPSLALRAGRNPLVALRATRPNWEGAADMASEPRACVALLRVRSSAHPGPPPRLQAGGPPPLLALRAGCRLLIELSLRCATRPIPVRLGHEHALASVVSARTPRGPLRPRMDAGCLGARMGARRRGR